MMTKTVSKTATRCLDSQDAVIADIPVITRVPKSWQPILKDLGDAKKAFDAGGHTGWKDCVANLQCALEKWRTLEPEDVGLGGLQPTSTQKKAKTKRQMAECLRVTLRQFVNYSPHSDVDRWTRNDALLALSSIVALIAIRKPESS
jgi:hypothetical protein